MNSTKNTIIENAGLNLLKNECPVLLGMPAYAIARCVFRKNGPNTPDEICGIGEIPFETSILEDYQDICGYHFPWGTLTEGFEVGDEEFGGMPCVSFSFAPRDVYLAFPDGWHLVDLFHQLYQSHPLRHLKFDTDPDDGIFDWTVISFKAQGKPEIKALRTWLVTVFIPQIWPNLLQEAIRIINQKKESVISPDGSFEELLSDRSRWLLCGGATEVTWCK